MSQGAIDRLRSMLRQAEARAKLFIRRYRSRETAPVLQLREHLRNLAKPRVPLLRMVGSRLRLRFPADGHCWIIRTALPALSTLNSCQIALQFPKRRHYR